MHTLRYRMQVWLWIVQFENYPVQVIPDCPSSICLPQFCHIVLIWPYRPFFTHTPTAFRRFCFLAQNPLNRLGSAAPSKLYLVVQNIPHLPHQPDSTTLFFILLHPLSCLGYTSSTRFYFLIQVLPHRPQSLTLFLFYFIAQFVMSRSSCISLSMYYLFAQVLPHLIIHIPIPLWRFYFFHFRQSSTSSSKF